MPTRDHAPSGRPAGPTCGPPTSKAAAVLQRAVRLGGPGADAEFGGYFMFTRDGVPVAGGMGDMGGHAGRQHLEDLPGHRRPRQDARGGGGRGAESSYPAMAVATWASRPC